ncbi:MAG: DUF309 domain-containing protein [Thaumarchaeota archaeon]|nr:DUF309 domain-containing protein [Nitrososphaerota archaeon]
MRFLVRFAESGLPKDRMLTSVRALGRSLGADARNPKWTSYGALELDIFCATEADFRLFLTAASPLFKTEFVRDLNKAPAYESEAQLFAESRDYFNAERYWECHEVLESVWRIKEGDEKRLLQGIILVCAAFVHYQKGEEEVALSVLGRAAKQLEFRSPTYAGIELPSLRANVALVLEKKRFSNFRV